MELNTAICPIKFRLGPKVFRIQIICPLAATHNSQQQTKMSHCNKQPMPYPWLMRMAHGSQQASKLSK